MFTKTIIAATLAGLAAAAPTIRAECQAGPDVITLLALRSGSAVHLSAINANGGKFWAGNTKPTTTYCPLETGCPANTSVTSFLASSSSPGLSMNAAVPGGQIAYVSPYDNSLSVSIPHGTPPAGSVAYDFEYTPAVAGQAVGSLAITDRSIYACQVTGAYQIFALPTGATVNTTCTPISLGTSVYNGTAPWEYI